MPAYDYDPATQKYTPTPEHAALMESARKRALADAPALTAVKRDTDKPRLSLIPRAAIEAEGRVMTFGAEKYSADNWRGGFAYRRLIDAAMRHLVAIADGEDVDPESGELHAAHVRCCMAFLIEQTVYGTGQDDRYPLRRTPATEDRAAPAVSGPAIRDHG